MELDVQPDAPLSNLHIALARMTALRRLRVFQCRQGLPINLQNTMKLHSKCVAAASPALSPVISVV